MYLKAIEIYGFKSFGEKIYIELDRGITAIVGPNGSGKSNIMDGVLWVLGEQSYKNIRAKDSKDVIFSGSGKNSNYAEVSLYIDNEDGYFENCGKVVKITRKATTTGINDYFIDGKKVRLKDISGMFLDTGIGKSAYSVIGQGKVERIISSSGKEIKQIIEEAAGIKKIQIRRSDSLKNLKHLEDELEKVELVVKTVGENRKNIEKQAVKAKEYLELKEEKETLEKSILLFDKTKKNKEKIETENSKNLSENEIELTEKEIFESDVLFENNENRRKELGEKIESNLNKNSELRDSIELSEREKAKITERVISFNREIEEKKSLDLRMKERIQGQRVYLETLNGEEETLDVQLMGLKEKNEEFSNKIMVLEKESSDLELNNEVKKRKIMELEVEKLRALNEIENSTRRTKTSETKLNSLKEETLDYKEKIVISETELKNINKINEENREKVEQISKRSEFLEDKISESSMKVNKLSETLRNDEYEEKRASLRMGNLIKLEESNEGLHKGVKEVLNLKLQGVYGIVANLINIPSGLEKAIEAGIPGNLQDIVVESSEIAKKCVNVLKEKKSGRASFLALNTIKVNPLKNIEKREGVLGLGAKLITSAPEYSKIVDFLLGNLLIVEKMEVGLEILKKNEHNGNIVTISGELLSSRGRITGGETQNSTLSQILERKKERGNLGALLILLRKNMELGNSNLEKEREILEKYENEICNIDLEEEKLKKNYKESEVESENAKAKYERLERDIKVLEAEYEDEIKYIEEFKKRIDNSTNERETTEKRISHMKEEIEKISKELISKNEDIRIQKEEYSDIRILYLNSENRKEQIKNDKKRFGNELDGILEENNKNILRIEELEVEIEKANNKNITIDLEVSSKLEKYEKENKEISDKKNDLAKVSEDERTLMEKRKKLETSLIKTVDKNQKENEKFQKLVFELERIEEELKELLEIKDFEILEDDFLNRKNLFKVLSQKINSFETVNILAIEEFIVLDEKYNYLNSQYNDINNSKKMLLKLIEEISEEISKRFNEAYTQINDNFNEMCTDILQNSEGKLLLNEGTNHEEAEIDIVVKYKNKRQQSLSLFSGGEKSMVAIAFILAIFMYKPSPFTFLDEIEAALDDKNTRKLIAKLKEFTNESQFILITHNKETMRESDTIFGVTMNKSVGISKIVPVKF